MRERPNITPLKLKCINLLDTPGGPASSFMRFDDVYQLAPERWRPLAAGQMQMGELIEFECKLRADTIAISIEILGIVRSDSEAI